MDGSYAPLPALSAGGLRSARQLVQRRGRQHQDAFLAEGPQAVREALETPDEVTMLIVGEDALTIDAVRGLVEHAMQTGVRTASVPAPDLAALSDTVHAQGIVAVCRQRHPGLDDVREVRLVLVCDQVRDPGNVGTMIRAADAFGADAVVLTSGCVEPWNPKAVRASTGSLFHLPVVADVPFDDVVAWLHGRGAQVLAADANGEPLDSLARAGVLSGPVGWVVGNEAWGFGAGDLTACDRVVSVPMWGRAESLNAASAIAVCLYQTAVAQHAS